MKKILIIFGYKQREYEYLCLLKTFLQKKGFFVKIRLMNFECYHETYKWKPDFIIINQFNSDENINFVKYAKKTGSRIIILNAELLFSMDRIHLKYASDCNKYVDYTIEAGNQEKFSLIEKYSQLDREKIKMFGTPKFDPYLSVIRKKLSIVYPYNKYLDPSKKTICICTSFIFSNIIWDNIKNNRAYTKIGKQKMRLIIRSHRKLQRSYIQLAEKLSKFNKYNILFRVHPLEDSKPYEKELGYIKNIILDNTVHQSKLFEVTDLLIHRSSTIAIEAWIFDIPTITFDPINNPNMELFSLTRFEKVFHNSNKLVNYIKQSSQYAETKHMKQEQKRYLKDEFGFSKNSKISASERIATFLTTIATFPKKKIFHPYIVFVYILTILRLMFIKKYIYEVIGLIKGKEYMRIYQENYVYDK